MIIRGRSLNRKGVKYFKVLLLFTSTKLLESALYLHTNLAGKMGRQQSIKRVLLAEAKQQRLHSAFEWVPQKFAWSYCCSNGEKMTHKLYWQEEAAEIGDHRSSQVHTIGDCEASLSPKDIIKYVTMYPASRSSIFEISDVFSEFNVVLC